MKCLSVFATVANDVVASLVSGYERHILMNCGNFLRALVSELWLTEKKEIRHYYSIMHRKVR